MKKTEKTCKLIQGTEQNMFTEKSMFENWEITPVKQGQIIEDMPLEVSIKWSSNLKKEM